MDLNLINANVNRLLTTADTIIEHAAGREYSRVIQFANLPGVTWSKVGELRGGSIHGGGDLTFSVKNANFAGSLERQELKVMVSQRGAGGISVKVYSLGQPRPLGVTIGYVQLNQFDFDIYLKRDQWNPCSAVGQNSSFNGRFDNFGEVKVEPTGIVYVPTHTVLNTDMDTGWLPLTLLNGWKPYFDVRWAGPNGIPSYRKLPDGTVEVRGLVAGGTFTNHVTLARLPKGFRSLGNLIVSGHVQERNSCSVDVYSDGLIRLAFPNATVIGTNRWVSLSFSFSTK